MDTIDYPKNERQWRATTGLDEKRFLGLLSHFEAGYLKEFGRCIEERRSDCPQELTFPTYKSLLFFTLFSLKSGLTYDMLGFVFKLDVSNAKRNISLGLRILKRALSEAGYLPKREFISVEEFREYFKGHDTIILDGSEQGMQRPTEQEEQKEFYSGKKKSTRLNR